MEDTWCLEGINMTLWSDRDRAWLAGTASCATHVGLSSLQIFPSLRETQQRTSVPPRTLVESAWQAEAWKLLMKQKSFTETRSWSLAFSLTHTFIFYSQVSLVYGSTCSLLVLSYYKCLLRLNSKSSPVFQLPRKSLSWPWAWNSVRMLPVQWHSELPLVLHYHLE